MRVQYTETDFETRFWENCSVWRITAPYGDPFGKEAGELMLDLDYVIEALPGNTCWHAPATLEFHGITDLKINLAASDSGFQNGPSCLLIASIARTPVQNKQAYFDRQYYNWEIQFVSTPTESGRLSLGAYGFTFRVGEAVLSQNPTGKRP